MTPDEETRGLGNLADISTANSSLGPGGIKRKATLSFALGPRLAAKFPKLAAAGPPPSLHPSPTPGTSSSQNAPSGVGTSAAATGTSAAATGIGDHLGVSLVHDAVVHSRDPSSSHDAAPRGIGSIQVGAFNLHTSAGGDDGDDHHS